METMKAELILEHIKQIWAENPQPKNIVAIAPDSELGIQQQLDANNLVIFYQDMEEGKPVVRFIRVEQ